MRQTFFFLFSGLILFSITSCNGSRKGDKEHVVAEVAGSVLTREELRNAIGKRLSPADSIRLADAYISNWIKEILLYEKAKDNIDKLEDINREAEEYKKRLIIFEYQKRLVNERLSTEVTDSELEQFYDLHKTEFTLRQPVVKGLFLKVPADAPQLNEVKKWMKKIDDQALEKIEKYSLQNALVYEYFLDRWVPLDQLMNNIPYEISNSNRFLKENKALEVTQDNSWYYLFIRQYVPAGEVQPFDYARDKVREALLNQKKKGFIHSVEEELYQKALRDERIIFYGKEPNDSK